MAARRAAPGASCPWVDSTAPVARRVAQLMSRMTLSDEITLVEGQGSTKPYVFFMAGIPKLCIPAMGLEDGPGGVGDGLTGVTQLPAPVSLAATWDPSLAYDYGKVVGAEQKGKGSAVDLGPTVNIDRDPRWGRSFETYTEDPDLNSAIAANEIHGIQNQGVMAQVKHYAAYNQETNRNTPSDDVVVSARALEEIYLPAFEAAAKQADVASVMCSYATVNGSYSCQNHDLLTTILKEEWGFPGFVTSDYGAVHSTAAAAAGTDMEQPESTYFGTALAQAVTSGAVPRAVLNTMVQRILTEMFRFNLLQHPPHGSTHATVTTPAHVAVSNRVAEAGTVLLQNTGHVLPLNAAHGGTVAVIGPAASTQATYGGGGSAAVKPSKTVTPLQGITAAAGPGTKIVYRQGLPADDALSAIPAADLSPSPPSGTLQHAYHGTLTAPETGTYVFALTNPCDCYLASVLSIGGTPLLNNPGTPPASTYSASIALTAGQTYSVDVSGELSSLTWATPAQISTDVASAVAVAKTASTAVVVVSDDTESEGTDRYTLNLPSAQNELVSAVAAANPHTVVVIDAGAPVAMPWLHAVAGVLDAWYPGQTNGTALGAVLFGRADPSGHLPVTFPRSLSQVPTSTVAQFPGVGDTVQYAEGIDVGYRWYDAKSLTPLFPFGDGGSYTTFRFSNLRTSGQRVDGTSDVGVTATLTNIGSRTGSEVAQLYLGDPASTGEPPRQLVGFRRVTLAAGASTTVHFSVTPQDRSWWAGSAGSAGWAGIPSSTTAGSTTTPAGGSASSATTPGGWTESTGNYRLYLGSSSALADLPLRSHFTVSATPGDRTVGITAPAQVARGKAFTATVRLAAGGNQTLHGVHLALAVPSGWSAWPLGKTTFPTVAAGSAPSVSYRVVAPARQPAMNGTLQATARFGNVQRQTGTGVSTS